MTSVQRRRAPLQADFELPSAPPPPLPPPPTAPLASAPLSRDDFVEGVYALRTRTTGFRFGENTLMIMGGIVAPLGILIVILGWVGAARTPLLFEQIPYLISGGLLGLAFVFLGSFFYFAHWITQLVKENRTQSSALIAAIAQLQAEYASSANGSTVVTIDNGTSTHATAEVLLVATQRGSMAHREQCAVVAGKADLRIVAPADGLAACKLCEPYETD